MAEASDGNSKQHMQVCTSITAQITMPAPQHSVFYRPDDLPAAQPTAPKHWRHSHNWLITGHNWELILKWKNTHFNSLFYRTALEYQTAGNRKVKPLILARQEAEPHANNLHFIRDRWPCRQFITQFSQARCFSLCPANSVNALKAIYWNQEKLKVIRPQINIY